MGGRNPSGSRPASPAGWALASAVARWENVRTMRPRASLHPRASTLIPRAAAHPGAKLAAVTGRRRSKRRGVVTTPKLLVAVLGMACAVSARGADQHDVQSALDKFRSVRPQEADLAIYQLDWMPTLKAAK